jgi:hypothetical protein
MKNGKNKSLKNITLNNPCDNLKRILKMRHAAVFSHLSLASTAAMLSSLLRVANMAATSSRLGTPPVTLGLK